MIASADGYSQGSYYLASLADEVYMHPDGIVFMQGFGSYRAYFSEAIDKLKIDRSFIRNMEKDKRGAAIVSAIIAMGHSLGLRVVAEGVETAEQRSYLRGTGCDEVQGYLFGRPVRHDEMNVLLLYGPTLAPS